MTENEAIRQLALRLAGALEEFRRSRTDPTLGMQHELPAMADVVYLVAEMVLALASKR